jgi:hypothetical protein
MCTMIKGLLMGIMMLILVLQGCRERERKDGPPGTPRDRLTLTELMRSEYQDTVPLDNRYFTPLGKWEVAKHEFEGTLIVPEFVMHNSEAEVDSARPWDYFPGFAADFFTHEHYLVPTARERILAIGDRDYWRIILSPGSVWFEPGDSSMSRASFPFVLVNERFNDVHNGLATFAYDDNHVSPMFLQVIQETSPVYKTDFWGVTEVTYMPHSLEEREALAARFAEEVQLQIPVLAFSELGEYADSIRLKTFNSSIPREEISATGLVWNGKLYVQPCYTRYGNYPYCRYMRHAAYSLTKAIGALVALLRLGEKYGDGVFNLKVANYVTITATHDGWESVTFADALNMATGVGDEMPERVEPNVMQGDEDQPKFLSFLRAKSRKEKMDIASSYANYPWGPGEVARYNSINTFVLSAAMDGFLKSKEGPDADIWKMVLTEVYQPIGIMYAPIMRTIEPDGSPGLPPFGYGLYLNIDDVAKLSMLFQSGGRYQGRQILHADGLAEAMFLTDVTGLPIGDRNEYGEITYHLAFDGLPYRGKDGLIHRMPFSTGFGGNHWVLLPNGITVFRFTDANSYSIETMIDVAGSLRPLE